MFSSFHVILWVQNNFRWWLSKEWRLDSARTPSAAVMRRIQWATASRTRKPLNRCWSWMGDSRKVRSRACWTVSVICGSVLHELTSSRSASTATFSCGTSSSELQIISAQHRYLQNWKVIFHPPLQRADRHSRGQGGQARSGGQRSLWVVIKSCSEWDSDNHVVNI